MTELDAVNEMLGVIGEPPVNTLEVIENVDVANALRILHKTSRYVQSKGWAWNTWASYLFNPDVYTNKIRWSDNILFLVGTDGTKYVQRDGYVFDVGNQTDIFEQPIEVTVIFYIDIENLLDPIAHYIVAKASRKFQNETLGDDSLDNSLGEAEQEAWVALQEYEMQIGTYNANRMTYVQQLQGR